VSVDLARLFSVAVYFAFSTHYPLSGVLTRAMSLIILQTRSCGDISAGLNGSSRSAVVSRELRRSIRMQGVLRRAVTAVAQVDCGHWRR
jgi:hypothetical protein